MKRYLIAVGIFAACAGLFGGILPEARAETAERAYCSSLGGTPNGSGACDLPNGTRCNESVLYRGGCVDWPGSPNAGVTMYNYRDDNGNQLRDGDLVSAARYGDPDIFIVKLSPHDPMAGYKRLFLNPAIFAMYGHLGGFANVRPISMQVRDLFETSGLFRNCETDDQRVWAVEVTGEDDAVLHHVEMTGEAASREDPQFFLRIFCINSREDRFYARSTQPYTRLADVPRYYRGPRGCTVRPACLDSDNASTPRCYMPEPASGWCPQPTPPPTTGPCYVGGCSGQLCTDRPDAVSTCEYRAEYACYQYARCERQPGGACGWTSTDQFQQCRANTASGY